MPKPTVSVKFENQVKMILVYFGWQYVIDNKISTNYDTLQRTCQNFKLPTSVSSWKCSAKELLSDLQFDYVKKIKYRADSSQLHSLKTDEIVWLDSISKNYSLLNELFYVVLNSFCFWIDVAGFYGLFLSWGASFIIRPELRLLKKNCLICPKRDSNPRFPDL